MKKVLTLLLSSLFIFVACSQQEQKEVKTEKTEDKQTVNTDNKTKPQAPLLEKTVLTKEEERIILHKGTERAFTGKYDKFYEDGLYVCKNCNAALYRSNTKFNSKCGWPSFDDNISDAVKRLPDADGLRTEIVCNKCDGHLGHVFLNEGFTDKNTRHCVNSLSMKFIPREKYGKAIFANGCFWGTEYFFLKAKGVISTSCGYIGGHVKNPTYKAVCNGTTGHAEAVEVIFDKSQTDFETLCKLFFETHDPSQVNRQGPDIGTQYRTEIFYVNEEQKTISAKLIKELEATGIKVATKVTKAPIFYDAEDYHQEYYKKKNGIPYCHKFEKKFLR